MPQAPPEPGKAAGALAGLQVITFETRRAEELARLLERHEAIVVRAPALQEVPLADGAPAVALARAIAQQQVAALVLLTGVGTRALVAAWTAEGLDAPSLLARLPLVARGPKPVAALREVGGPDPIRVAAPHTWREVLAALDDLHLPRGATIAVQEYGTAPVALLEALAARGYAAQTVAVYRWALPADLAPLAAAAVRITQGAADILVFTSAVQVEHLLRVAPDPAALRAGAARCVIASIGPTCSEALEAHGLSADLEAEPPKMGPLVARVAERARHMLLDKR